MSENHRQTYRALVAALRAEFSPLQIEVLKIQLDAHRYDNGAAGALRQAVSDAWDVVYDAAATKTEYAYDDPDDGMFVGLSRADAEARSTRWGGPVYVREVTEWCPDGGEQR